MAAFAFSQISEEAPEVVDIQINGNKALSSKDLLNQLRIKEKRLVSKGSFYNRHHLAREIEKLEDYYTLHGFLDAEITDSLAIGEENVVIIILKVVEGKQYYLKDVILTGNNVFSEADYLEFIDFKAGSTFNTFKIREDLIEMLALYQTNGYPLINIRDSVVVADSVSLYIRVKEGPKLNYGAINIQEVSQIPDKIIRRELIFNPGEEFNITNVEESKRRLYETNLFNSVNISLGNVNYDQSTVDIDVEVIAAKFRGFDMNMGIKQWYPEATNKADPVLGVGVSGSWYHNNLFDQSRGLRVETEVSSIYPSIFIPQQFKLDFFYVEPWILKMRVPLTINPFYWYIDNKSQDFSNTAFGLRAITTYRWFRRVKIQTFAEWSQSTSVGTPINIEEEYKEARKLGMKLTWDRRDDFFHPQNGFKFVIEPEMVGYFLGGENDYTQIQSSFSSFWNLFRDIVFAHNMNIGIAFQKDPDVPILYQERFFLGGNSSIRGFEQQMVGPMSSEAEPLGGNLRFYTNFELRFPILSIIGGTAFLDAGNLWAEVEEASFSDMVMAAGVGI